MENDYSYDFQDKYYKHAASELRSTMYEAIERQEIILNNIENRIASEENEEIKAYLLNIWTRQSESVDKSINSFRQLFNSIKESDTYIGELIAIERGELSVQNNNTLESGPVASEEEFVAPVEENEMASEEIPAKVDEGMHQEEVIADNNIELSNLGDTEESTEVTEEIPVEANLNAPQEEQISPMVELSSLNDIEKNNENDSNNSLENSDSSNQLLSLENNVIEENSAPVVNDTTEDQIVLPADFSVEKIDTTNNNTGFDINPNDDTQAFEPIVDPNLETAATETDNSSSDMLLPPLIEEPQQEEVQVSLQSLATNNLDENNNLEEKHDLSNVNISVSKVSKVDNNPSKAIIVNDSQYQKLVDSLDEQEKKLYDNGLLSSNLVANSNYVLSANNHMPIVEENAPMDLNQVVDEVVNNEAEEQDVEKMIEKANELYKAGQTNEAQALFDEISLINQAKQQENNPALVKAA